MAPDVPASTPTPEPAPVAAPAAPIAQTAIPSQMPSGSAFGAPASSYSPYSSQSGPVVGAGSATGQPPNAPADGYQQPAMGGQPQFPSSKRSLKPLLIALLALIVVGGGSAAAYVGVIAPNKPENILKAAIDNGLKQQQTSFDGTLNIGSVSDPSSTYKVEFSGSSDAAAKAAETKIKLTTAGVAVPVEARLVNKNVYFKVGDLSSIATLAGAYDPSLATMTQAISKEISNKWIYVDSTLLDQAGAGCALDTSWALTKADVKLLEDQYSKHPFTTIVSSSSDTVGGKKVQKYELSIDDDKAAAYGKNLKDLSLVKSLEKCSPSSALSNESKSTGDHDKTPLTVWIDKGSKQIVQVASHSTAQDAKKDDLKGSATVKLSYGKVSVTAPTGAVPAIDVLANLEKSLGGNSTALESLFGGDTSGVPATPLSSPIKNSKPATNPSLQTKFRSFVD